MQIASHVELVVSRYDTAEYNLLRCMKQFGDEKLREAPILFAGEDLTKASKFIDQLISLGALTTSRGINPRSDMSIKAF